jgi:hypothetical protein
MQRCGYVLDTKSIEQTERETKGLVYGKTDGESQGGKGRSEGDPNRELDRGEGEDELGREIPGDTTIDSQNEHLDSEANLNATNPSRIRPVIGQNMWIDDTILCAEYEAQLHRGGPSSRKVWFVDPP